MIETPQRGHSAGKLCILIVEDSDLLREMYHTAFGSRDEVYTAASAEEGWQLYLDKSPNIIFLDIGLPDGSGHDLARTIKDHSKDSYIVMATASHDIGDKMEATRNHVDGYIVKPFSKHDINAYVDRYQSLHRRKRTS
ncbi:MAG: response regulator [Alphaproteobacteria bacterium]